jgi:tetratricopeptide (TPR) repeat protein
LVLRVVREQLAQQGRLAMVCQSAATALDVRARVLARSLDRPSTRDVPEQVAALQQAADGLAGKARELEADILRLRRWALHLLNELGDSARQAIAAGNSLVEDAERVLGPDHPDTLSSRNDLASAYWVAGRVAEAIPLHQRTLADMERVLGPDHPHTLQSRGNLATAYQDAGRVAEAIPLHERNLADMERVLGPDHPHTLASRGNLATSYQKAGRVAEAISLNERNLADRERVLGPDHPHTLATRNNLATAYQEVGGASGASSRRRWWGLRRNSSL